MATKAQQKDFIEKIAPLAQREMKKSDILASITIAQAILESGWGLSGLTRKSNNLFGIKGSGISSATFEVVGGKRIDIVDSFRTYSDWEESVSDHTRLLMLPRYRNIVGEKDFRKACRNLQEDGYATAENYAECLIALIEEYSLDRYDAVIKYRVIFPYLSTKSEAESIIKWVRSNAKYNGIIEEEK